MMAISVGSDMRGRREGRKAESALSKRERAKNQFAFLWKMPPVMRYWLYCVEFPSYYSDRTRKEAFLKQFGFIFFQEQQGIQGE